MTRGALEIRPFTDAELPEALALLGEVFHDPSDEDDLAAERSVHDPTRSWAAFAGDRMVGCLGCYSHDVSVPGGSVPTAGTTWVAVAPTHRRRGVLRQLMTAHLAEAREHGDAIAMLWASEAAIYGRFGYGVAAENLRVVLRSGPGLSWRTDVPWPDAELRAVRIEEAHEVLDPIHEAVRRQRAGMHARSPVWWRFQLLTERKGALAGWSGRHVVVAAVEGEDVAYAIYDTKQGWTADEGPQGRVRVVDLAGVDGVAEGVMWRFLADIDLTTTVSDDRRPADDHLHQLLLDPRRLNRKLMDGLYVRILDLEAALSARTYAASAGVTVEVRDTMVEANDGTWRIEVAPEGVLVAPTDEPAELRMDVRELGGLYLGADHARGLARAGRIEVRDEEALEALAAAMRTPLSPWGPEVW